MQKSSYLLLTLFFLIHFSLAQENIHLSFSPQGRTLLTKATDSSIQWEGLGGPYYPWKISFDINERILVGARRGIFRLENDDTTWSQLYATPSIYSSVNSICVLPSGDIWAGTSEGLVHSTNNGLTWITSFADTVISVVIASKSNDLYVTWGYALYSSTNGGASWKNILNDGYGISAMSIDRQGNLFVADGWSDTTIGGWRSTDSGATWKHYNIIQNAAHSQQINTLLVTANNYLIAGTSAATYLSTDGGVTWASSFYDLTYQSGGQNYLAPVTAIAQDSLGNLFAGTYVTGSFWNGGDGYGLFRSTNTGSSWELVDSLGGTSASDIQVDAKNRLLIADYSLFRSLSTTSGIGKPLIRTPMSYELMQNYPNPFNPSTVIQFTVPTDGRATLKVYDTLGQEVTTLFDGAATAGEYHQATFDASRLASGVYFSRLEFGGKMKVKKMLLLK